MTGFHIREKQKTDIKVAVAFQRWEFEGERQRNCVNLHLGEKLEKCPEDAKLVMVCY